MALTVRSVALPYGARLVLSTDIEGALYQVQVRQKLLRNPRPLLEALAVVLRQEARNNFSEGGDPSWQPLAQSTVAAKALAGLPAKTGKGRIPWRLKQGGRFGPENILIMSGRLRDSWSLKGNKDHFEQIDVSNCSVRVGSTVEYAKYHQAGTSAYQILAAAGKVLAFTNASGATVFATKVNHPGLVARPVTISDGTVGTIRDMTIAYIEADPMARVQFQF